MCLCVQTHGGVDELGVNRQNGRNVSPVEKKRRAQM